MFDLVVRGDPVLPDRVLEGGFLAVQGGVIGALGVGEAPEAAESVDASGHLIFPGVIDGQVHAGSCEGIAGLADGISADAAVRRQLDDLQNGGFGHFPVCMAKTQYSFSADAALRNVPSGFEVPVREVRLSGGAEFVVVICGAIMTMPGLPRVPAADNIAVNEAGHITGLF